MPRNLHLHTLWCLKTAYQFMACIAKVSVTAPTCTVLGPCRHVMPWLQLTWCSEARPSLHILLADRSGRRVTSCLCQTLSVHCPLASLDSSM